MSTTIKPFPHHQIHVQGNARYKTELLNLMQEILTVEYHQHREIIADQEQIGEHLGRIFHRLETRLSIDDPEILNRILVVRTPEVTHLYGTRAGLSSRTLGFHFQYSGKDVPTEILVTEYYHVLSTPGIPYKTNRFSCAHICVTQGSEEDKVDEELTF